MDFSELADVCQNLAAILDQKQEDENYEGQEAMKLGELSANLSAQASTLRTLAVSQAIQQSQDAQSAIQQSQDAQSAIQDSTNSAKKAVEHIKIAGQSIEIAGSVISLVAAIITGNPQAIITTGKDLIDAAEKIT